MATILLGVSRLFNIQAILLFCICFQMIVNVEAYDCFIGQYSNSNIQPGAYCECYDCTNCTTCPRSRSIVVGVEFIDELDRLNEYAKECGVLIEVCKSLELINLLPDGQLPDPPSRSSCLVGHAIQIHKLVSRERSCDVNCIISGSYPKSVCLMNKVKSDIILNASITDTADEKSVSINDNLLKYNPAYWLFLYSDVQLRCPKTIRMFNMYGMT